VKSLPFALSLALLPTAPAVAAEDGVWQGTIGSLPVRVCLAKDPDSDGWWRGSYYYLSRLAPIGLEAAAQGSDLVVSLDSSADQADPRWNVARTATGGLTGQWKSKTRSLPIALRPVPWRKNDDGPCGSDAFLAPRLKPLTVRAAPATKAGIRYTKLTYVAPAFPGYEMRSFALPETQPGDKAINAALRLDPAKENGPGDYVSCARTALTQVGTDGYFSGAVEPDLITPEFVSAQVSIGWDCGGAHPSEANYHWTFDRRTGVAIDLSRWFLPSALGGQEENGERWVEPKPALQRLILRNFPFDPQADECREPITGQAAWTLSLQRKGIGFYPSLPHVIQACAETAVVPFAELTTMLSPAGKHGVARLTR
jgi:hypothetical protein